jgi:hypothetical protein
VHAYATIQLEYYPQVTPSDYEPPGFDACDNTYNIMGESEDIRVGELLTPHHGVNLRVKTRESVKQNTSIGSTLGDVTNSIETMHIKQTSNMKPPAPARQVNGTP